MCTCMRMCVCVCVCVCVLFHPLQGVWSTEGRQPTVTIAPKDVGPIDRGEASGSREGAGGREERREGGREGGRERGRRERGREGKEEEGEGGREGVLTYVAGVVCGSEDELRSSVISRADI